MLRFCQSLSLNCSWDLSRFSSLLTLICSTHNLTDDIRFSKLKSLCHAIYNYCYLLFKFWIMAADTQIKRILSKFLVLSWKNLLLKKRHWFMTILEVVLPIVLFILLAVLRYDMIIWYATLYENLLNIIFVCEDPLWRMSHLQIFLIEAILKM